MIHISFDLNLQIYRAPVKLISSNMAEINRGLTTTKDNTASRFQSFRFVKDSTLPEAYVVIHDGTKFGILDERSSKALDSLIPHPELELDGQAETSAIRDVISRCLKASQAVIRVDIRINGPANLSEEVGSRLSVHKVWLQRPSAPRFPYRNPQTISFPGMEAGDIQAPRDGAEIILKGKKQSIQSFHETMAGVYDTLKRDKDLVRIEGDVRLKTALLG